MQDQVSFLAASSLYPRGSILGTEYVCFFIDYFTRAEVAFVPDKTRFYDHCGEKLNERQGKVIARMFQEDRAGFKGGLSAKNYVSITRCSPVTATHDLPQLRYMGALLSHGRGRGKRYEISYLEAGAMNTIY